LLEHFPPVYPILSLADVYLGDASSVGYDYLFYERPMFFFPAKHSGRLHTCGRLLDPAQDLYSQLDETNRFAKEQRKLYQYAFGPRITEEHLRANVMQMLARF
jgi:CDP-glycerol glycerophosphotransferase (TagB/SpsB family)